MGGSLRFPLKGFFKGDIGPYKGYMGGCQNYGPFFFLIIIRHLVCRGQSWDFEIFSWTRVMGPFDSGRVCSMAPV